MMWNDGNWSVGGWLVMTLVMLAFWGAVAVLIVGLVRTGRGASRRSSDEHTHPAWRANEILDERFARDEINEDEFTSRSALLRSSVGHA